MYDAPAVTTRPQATLCALLLVLLWSPVAGATVTQGLELPDLTAQSQRVVLGRVTHSQPQWDPDGMRIFTAHTVDVTESLKGTTSTNVTVFTWGGTVGELGQRVLGEPDLQPGDEAVFFLEQSPVAGAHRVVGLAQGVWRVSRGTQGRLWVSRTASRLMLRVPGRAPGTFATVADVGVAAVTLEDFRAQVLLLGGARP